MIDAYTIGITLALNNGVSDGIAAIREDLQTLDKAVEASSLGLAHLRQAADTAVAGAMTDIARLIEATRRVAALLPRLTVGATPEVSEPEEPLPPRPEPGPRGLPAVIPRWRPVAPSAQEVTAPSASAPALIVPQGPSLPAARGPQSPPSLPSPPSPPLAPQPAEAPQTPPLVPPPAPRQLLRDGQAPTAPAWESAPTPRAAAPSERRDRSVRRSPATSAEPEHRSREDRERTSTEVPPVAQPIDYASVARLLSPLPLTPPKTSETTANQIEEHVPPPVPPQDRPADEPAARPPYAVPAYRPAATQSGGDDRRGLRPLSAEASREVGEGRAPTRPVVAQYPSLPSTSPPPLSAPTRPNLLSTGLPSAARQQTRAEPMPTTVEVILDGASIGRWMDQRMARAASRPPSGTTSFDPRVTPVWTTVPVAS